MIIILILETLGGQLISNSTLLNRSNINLKEECEPLQIKFVQEFLSGGV
jgi:hypothetical protein